MNLPGGENEKGLNGFSIEMERWRKITLRIAGTKTRNLRGGQEGIELVWFQR